MDKRYMGADDMKSFWGKRLVPNMVFEDSKAVQKIENGLHLIGLESFRICTTPSLPANWTNMNRVWICLPRNERALNKLREYNERCFEFTKKRGTGYVKILWKPNKGHSTITVKSPLSEYLKEQRGDVKEGDEWNTKLRDIIAVDYCVVARFSDKNSSVEMSHGSLKDYFLGGIRGLGTWGAAWYIDNQYSAFTKYGPEDPIQSLLEVTFMKGSIFSVTDVSNESQEYFDQQCKLKVIKKKISDFCNNRI
jgi:hypothetical protein